MSDGLSHERAPAATPAGLLPVTDLDDSPLLAEEIAYGQASKASATIEAYRTDWQEFDSSLSDVNEGIYIPKARR